ncbi:MAG TPA: methionine gamma-lyase [Candidatus Marinimicrobia bacterium]|nr:MAG: hypothetical protein AUJ47_13250 [Candidatus Marinimicrobia bacterium CG1_02_48_14]HCW75045.1 methionine gamma-lyase [Candidatus Neomarinimicrobiota bacterium]
MKSSTLNPNYGFNTLSIHAGEPHPCSQNAHVAPIYQSSTYSFPSAEEGGQIFKGEKEGYVYGRMGSPNMTIVSEKVAALEGRDLILAKHAAGETDFTVEAHAFSSGMNAITTLMLTLLKPGDTIIAQSSLYGGTVGLFNNLLTKYNIKVVWVAHGTLAAFEQTIAKFPEAKLVYCETPANPTLEIVDIEGVANLAHTHNMPLVVDNTFATPYLQRPLALGADWVIHSTTKYIGGHGVVVGGMVVSPYFKTLSDELLSNMHNTGGVPSPFDAWLLNMGLKTLPLRMDRHCDNAEKIAAYLENHPKVSKVWYPGLESHTGHDLAKKQMKRYGGMISFELKGGLDAGIKMMDSIQLMILAVSLGTVDTLIQHPASMTHAKVPVDQRHAAGITDGLVRVSIGLENIEDLLTDFDQALAKV